MPPKSGNYEMADRLADGNLANILREARANGDSLNTISRQLFADYGVTISVQTVANWLAVLEEEAVA